MPVTECGEGLLRELSPGPLTPEARIMPLDQAAMKTAFAHFCFQADMLAEFAEAQNVPGEWPASKTDAQARLTRRQQTCGDDDA